MSQKKLVFGAAAAAVIGAAAVFFYGMLRQSSPAFVDPADRSLVLRGKAVYASNCAACHGASLQGQPNWRQRLPNGRIPAPPHDKTGHTWHHPDAVLLDIIKNGLVPGRTAPPGYASDMPAFGGTLSDDEIVAVLAYIKSFWPSEVLQMQKEVALQLQRRN